MLPSSCVVCGEPEAEFTCGLCETVRYCGAECQHVDWYDYEHTVTCDASLKEKWAVFKKWRRQTKKNNEPARKFHVKPRVNNITEDDLKTVFGEKLVARGKKRFFGKQKKGKKK